VVETYRWKGSEGEVMKDNILIKDLEKAKGEVHAFNTWQGHAKIMYDISDGDIWTDVFANSNEQNIYHSDTIICVYGKDDLWGRSGKVSLEKLIDTYIPDAISDKETEDKWVKKMEDKWLEELER
jgi:hypothetical protein